MKKLLTGAMLMGPVMAFAQSPINATLTQLSNVVTFLIPVLLSMAVLVFFWGLVKYIANASDEAAKEGGKTLMIWGMVAIFVMVAFWGIIGYFQQSIGLSGTVVAPVAPVVNMIPTT